MRKPVLVVLKGGALAVLAHACPQPPHQMGRPLQVYVNENLLVHYFPPDFCGLGGFWGLARRIRSGSCSSSSSRPTASWVGSARSPKRSTIPSAKRTVA